MRFWLREIAGWLLLVLGLFGFYVSFLLLLDQKPIDAGPLTFIAFIVFRGGMQLLKVAVAARICLQAQEPPPPATTARKTALDRPRMTRNSPTVIATARSVK
jgi:hypothetical protein